MSVSPDRRALLAGLAASIVGARELLARELSALAGQDGEGVSLRDAYALEPGLDYLNHAAIGTVPRVVLDAHAEYARVCERNPWLYVWGGAWDEAVDGVRARAAAYVGCAPGELAVTRNTTEGFNVLAQGLPLAPGDEVVFSTLNHIGASRAWEHQARRRGFSVRRFDFPTLDVPDLSDEDVLRLHLDALSDATRVLVLPHVDNIVGLRHPVAALARAARERGVRWVCVDGAQAVGALPVTLSALGVDAYATSAHKWLQAPKGTGLLYVSAELREVLEPMVVTWGQARWKDSARRYTDYGTRDLPGLLALEDAVAFQETVGAGRAAHDRALFEHARARADAHPRLAWRSPRAFERGAPVYSVGVDGSPVGELAAALFTEERCVVRPFAGADGHGALRLSPNLTCGEADLDRCFDALEARLV